MPPPLLQFLLGALLAAGCQGVESHPDAAPDAEGDGDAPAGDLDPGTDLGLLVPQGTHLCVLGAGRAPVDQLRLKARLTLRPGFVRLPREGDTFEAELLEALELTPGLGVPEPAGPGTFTRQASAGLLVYRFEQAFLAGGQPFQVTARFTFEVVGGAVLVPLQTLDERWLRTRLVEDPSWLTAGFAGGEELWRFYACAPEGRRTNVYTFGMVDGATLTLEEWMIELSGGLGDCAAGLARATFTRGAETRVIEDDWRTALQPGNHGIVEWFAVRLEPALGNAHGLLVVTQSLGGPLVELASVTTLDAALEPGERLPLASASYQGTACSMQGP